MHVALNQLCLADLEAAINKARTLLSSMKSIESEDGDQTRTDLAVLAGLYGKMIYYQQVSIPMALLSDTEQVTLLNWATR
jgi:hypothetical protein